MKQYVPREKAKQLSMSQGLVEFTELVASKAQQWGKNFASAIQNRSIALELGKDTRTVTRYIQQLEEKGLIEHTAKRGKNGGTVIVFNTSVLNFEPTENPITSDTKEMREIRERVFPTAPKKMPKKRYRTKAQIAEDRALRSAIESKQNELNDLVESLPYVNREFFDNFDEPDMYFKGYLCAQMYNAYAVVFPKRRYELYKGRDEQISQEGYRSMNRASAYNVLPTRFVGTPQYAKFVELANYCMENDINPLGYLTVQFEYAEWLAQAGKARVGAIPYVNTLLCDQAKHRFLNRKQFYADMRKQYGLFMLSPEPVGFVGAKYPIVSTLFYAYKYGKQTNENLDTLLADPLKALVPSPKTVALFGFYETVKKELDSSDMSPENVTVLKTFMKEQVALFSARHTFSKDQYLLAFPLQIHTARQAVELANMDIEEYYLHIGNSTRQKYATDLEINGYIEDGEAIDFSLRSNVYFERTLRMLAEYRGLGVAPNAVRVALKEFGVEKIPLDTFGMLDINALYDKLLTGEELEETESQNFENAQCFRFTY